MTKYFRTDIKEKLEVRYAMFDREQNGDTNVVIDSFAPKMMIRGLTNVPSTSYAISDYIANTFKVRQLPLQYMVEILGFKKSRIKQLLLQTKKEKLNIIFAGFGGTGVNTWHWLSKIMEWTGIINLFENVAVYDNDKIEMSNLLRFPIDLNKNFHSINKIDMFNNYARLSKNSAFISLSTFPRQNYDQAMNPFIKEVTSVKNENGSTEKMTVLTDNTFVYGAPDLESRLAFSHMKFLAATHGDNRASMVINPEINTDLQVESYGLIRLNSFFMNQLRMAIGLLEFLSADDKEKWDTPDETVFDFNFKEFIESNEQGKTEKTISFQVEHSGLMEDEGATNA